MPASRAFRLAFAVFFVLLFAYVLWEARFGFGATVRRAALFPLAIGIPCLVFAVLVVLQELRSPIKVADAAPVEGLGEQEAPIPPDVARRRTMTMMGWVVGCFLAIWLLGFSIAVAAVTFLYLKVTAREKWPISIALTALSYGFFYGAFDRMLHIPFPEGLLFEWWGSVTAF
jgi:hypothetical protein